MKSLTIKEFVKDLQKDDNFSLLSYSNIWTYINNNEGTLVKEKIIEVRNLGINSEKLIVNTEKMKSFLKKKVQLRKNSINAFLKQTPLMLSYSQVYSFIANNEKILKKEKVIETSEIQNSKKSIIILDFKKLEERLGA